MEDKWIIDWPVSKRFPHYTRANAGEVMSDPVSPLSWTLGWENAMVLGLRDGWIRGGTHEMSDFDADYPENLRHLRRLLLHQPGELPDAGCTQPRGDS